MLDGFFTLTFPRYPNGQDEGRAVREPRSDSQRTGTHAGQIRDFLR